MAKESESQLLKSANDTLKSTISKAAGSISNDDKAIIAAVKTQNDKIIQMQNDLIAKDAVLNQIHRILPETSDIRTIPSVIESLKMHNKELHSTVEANRKKLKKAKKNAQSMITDCDGQFSVLQNEFETVPMKARHLEQDYEDAKRQIDALKRDKQALQRKVQEQETHISSSSARHEDIVSEMQEDVKRQIETASHEMTAKISEANKEKEAATTQLAKVQEKYELSKRAIKLLNEKLAQKTRTVEEFRIELEETLKRESQRIVSSHTNETSSLRSTIEGLQNQLNESRRTIETLSVTKTKFETQAQNLKGSTKILKSEQIILEDKIKNLESALEREKQLSETKLNAERVRVESIMTDKTVEIKNECEKEKQNMINLISREFYQYVTTPGYGAISFEGIVKDVKNSLNEMKRREESVRRQLNIGQSESIEDAISRLVLHQNHCFI